MNLKALALGAVIGFAVALTPACGSGGPECNSSNCETCCSPDGKTCLAGTTDQACGSAGLTCQSCSSNQTCQNGACVTKTSNPDAGNGCNARTCPHGCCSSIGCLPGVASNNCGNGGAVCEECTGEMVCQDQACAIKQVDAGNTCDATTCPNGCCSQTGCQTGNTVSSCGTGGVACATCDSVETCGVPEGETDRQCFRAGTIGGVGDLCLDDAECTSGLGPNAACKQGADDSSFKFPHAFCTLPCSDTVACPGDSVCVPNSVSDGITSKLMIGIDATDGSCFKPCDAYAAADVCGDGFFCQFVDPYGDAACLPLTPMPTGIAGQACVGNELVCSNPPSNGFCYPDFDPNSGDPTGFTGGSCMADCTAGNNCASDSLCIGVGNGLSYCVEKCSGTGTRSTCRSPGYTCMKLQSGTAGVCLPDCQQPTWECSSATQTCNATTGQCQ